LWFPLAPRVIFWHNINVSEVLAEMEMEMDNVAFVAVVLIGAVILLLMFRRR